MKTRHHLIATRKDFNNLITLKKKMNTVRLIIFDLDGTLIQSQIEYETIRQKLKNILRDYVEEDYYQQILKQQISILELIELIKKFSNDPEAAKRALNIVEDFEFKGYENARVMPEVYELLKELKKKGIKIAVLTNNSKKLTTYALENYGLSEFIDAVITRDDIKNRKPDPEGINLLVKRFGIKREECIFVGDSWLDAEASKNAGVEFVRIILNRKKQNNNDYRVIVNLKELSDIIN